jgi:hypothetical protein
MVLMMGMVLVLVLMMGMLLVLVLMMGMVLPPMMGMLEILEVLALLLLPLLLLLLLLPLLAAFASVDVSAEVVFDGEDEEEEVITGAADSFVVAAGADSCVFTSVDELCGREVVRRLRVSRLQRMLLQH